MDDPLPMEWMTLTWVTPVVDDPAHPIWMTLTQPPPRLDDPDLDEVRL